MRSLGTALLCLALQCAHAQTASDSSNSIVFGQSAPLSGAAGQLGVEMNFGANVYLYEVNRTGGVNGRRVELKVLDDRNDTKRAVENTKRLISDDRVFALLGYVGAAPAQAVLPILTQHGMPLVGIFSGADSLRSPYNPYVFNVRAGYLEESQAIVRHLLTVGITRIAVFYENDSNGQAGLLGVERALGERNLRPVATGSVEPNGIDVSEAMRRIMPAAPQAVVMISAYGGSVSFIREVQKLVNRPALWNVSFVGSQVLARELDDRGRGIQISQVVPFPWNARVPVVREYQEAMAQVNGELSFGSLEGYITAKIAVEGLRRAGKLPTRASYLAALESMNSFDVGGYLIRFQPGNHNGSSFVDLTMMTANRRFIR
jgi:ABC-type branched-subunit amino acid transport system substrate-binding protein